MALSFERRIEIGEFVENTFSKFFEYRKLNVIPFAASLKSGLDKNLPNNDIKKALRADIVKKNKAIILFRYAPDFLLLQFEENVFKDAMFFDVKAMFTPVFLDTFHQELEKTHGEKIPLENIANVEREAFDSYTSYQKAGAKVFLLIACSYHPAFTLCEYIENIRELYRDVRDRNPQAAGSTTPRVNIDLGSMRPLQQFVKEEFGIDTDTYKLHARLREKLNFIACPGNLAEKHEVKVEQVRQYLSGKIHSNLVLETA